MLRYIVDVDPPNEENMRQVSEHYFSKLNISDIDYDKIIEEFSRNESSGKFSNSGIEEIYKKACAVKANTTQDIIEIIKKSKPNITSDDLKNYETNKKELLKGDSGDN